ncbi:MAG: galactose oxidase [Lacunisphaera sp.]|nr:galactose oxidase [Lacunisphaera sp.]
MKLRIILVLSFLAIRTPQLLAGSAAAGLRWGSLPALPDQYGFAAMYAGSSGDVLLAAGGANFSERPLKEGGTKVWHDRIFVLSRPDGHWQVVGRLPRPSAYGVSGTWRDAVVYAGGGDARTNFSEAWLMRWNGQAIAFESLPSLPIPIANGSGMVMGNVFYVIGGQGQPDSAAALAHMFALDLGRIPSERQWEEKPWPAGAPARIHAVVGAHHGELYLFSGIELFADSLGKVDRRYLRDAHAFRSGRGWRRLADMPQAIAAAPSPAIEFDAANLLILGGVNAPWGSATGPGGATPGFTKRIWAYRPAADTWSIFAEGPTEPDSLPARVTAPLVAWHGRFVAVSGEIAPGIRTSTVLSLEVAP